MQLVSSGEMQQLSTVCKSVVLKFMGIFLMIQQKKAKSELDRTLPMHCSCDIVIFSADIDRYLLIIYFLDGSALCRQMMEKWWPFSMQAMN